MQEGSNQDLDMARNSIREENRMNVNESKSVSQSVSHDTVFQERRESEKRCHESGILLRLLVSAYLMMD